MIAPDLDSLPGKNWTTVVARTSKSPWLHNGYCEPGGFMPYKKAVCDYLRQYRGLRCEPEQVITTNGTQQALDLCASVLFEKEDKIAVEDPYFQTAHQPIGVQRTEADPNSCLSRWNRH